MSIGEQVASSHSNWASPGRWSPAGFVPSGRLLWSRNRFRLHASAVTWILAWASFVGFVVWAERASGESRLFGIAAAVVWAAAIGPLLHEAGHALVGRRVGFEVTGFGLDRNPYVSFRAPGPINTPRAWALMAVAGPASDLLCAVCFAGVWLLLGANAVSLGAVFCLYAGVTQACMGFVNLVPRPGSDGSIIQQAFRFGRVPVVDEVEASERFTICALKPNDKAAVLALFTDEVARHQRLGDDYRERLGESFESDIAQLHLGVPTRLGVRNLADDSLVAFLHIHGIDTPTKQPGPMVALGMWIRDEEPLGSTVEILKSALIWLHDDARFDVVLLATTSEEEDSLVTATGARFAFHKAITFADGSTRMCKHYSSRSPDSLERAQVQTRPDTQPVGANGTD